MVKIAKSEKRPVHSKDQYQLSSIILLTNGVSLLKVLFFWYLLLADYLLVAEAACHCDTRTQTNHSTSGHSRNKNVLCKSINFNKP